MSDALDAGGRTNRMRPLRYMPNDHPTGARIGGTVPRGLESEVTDDLVQYFGTFPITAIPSLEFSVFHRFDTDGADEARDIIEHNNSILTSSNLLWVVVHGVSERGSALARPFEARGIQVGPESPDETVDDDGTVMPHTESKLGGACFLDRGWLRSEVDELEKAGYQQLLQIGMHGADLIDGFPWDPGYLHVWAKAPDKADTYRFMVEQ